MLLNKSTVIQHSEHITIDTSKLPRFKCGSTDPEKGN